MQKLLSSSDTKFSSLTYKEMCSSQRGELTIKSSELRGLSKLLGRDFFLWRMIGENIAGCRTFMNDFVVQAQLSVDQLSVCVLGSLYDFVYYLLSPFNEQTYPQRETLNFSMQELFRNWMAVLRRTSVRNMRATGNLAGNRNVSCRNSLRRPIYIVNSDDKTKLSCPTDEAPHFFKNLPHLIYSNNFDFNNFQNSWSRMMTNFIIPSKEALEKMQIQQ